MPSHQTSPSGVIATLVKIVSCSTICIALGFDCALVPGATPKYPASGIDRPQPAVRSDAQPCDVVADREYAPSV